MLAPFDLILCTQGELLRIKVVPCKRSNLKLCNCPGDCLTPGESGKIGCNETASSPLSPGVKVNPLGSLLYAVLIRR